MSRSLSQALVFALAGITMVAIAPAAAEPRVRFDPALLNLAVDGEAIVTVHAEEVPAPGLAAYQLDLAFDPAVVEVTPVDADPCFAPATGWMLDSTGRTAVAACGARGPGQLSVAYASHGGSAPPQGSGEIAAFRIRALAHGAERIDDAPPILAGTDVPATPYATGREPLLVLVGPAGADGDGDGIPDSVDNCTGAANADPTKLQSDADGDGYGDVCDCDFDNSGACNIDDFGLFLSDFLSGSPSTPGTDMTADGSVNIDDFTAFLPGFLGGSPGPSGLVP